MGELALVGDHSTVPLTRISCNTVFSKSQKTRKAGTLCKQIKPRPNDFVRELSSIAYGLLVHLSKIMLSTFPFDGLLSKCLFLKILALFFAKFSDKSKQMLDF